MIRWLKKKVYFNLVLSVLIGGCLDFSIAAILDFRMTRTDQYISLSNAITALSAVILAVLFGLAVFAFRLSNQICSKSKVHLEEKQRLMKRFGNLFDGLSNRKVSALRYGSIFILRRMLLALILCSVVDIGIQLFLLQIL